MLVHMHAYSVTNLQPTLFFFFFFFTTNSLVTPWTSNLPGSSVHGISQARILSGLPLPLPGDLPDPGIEP